MNKINSKVMMCDMHTHSQSSHDSIAKIEDVARACLNKNISVFAVTDHCDIEYCDSIDIPSILESSLSEIENTAVLYRGKIEILKGVEIGEALWNKQYTSELMNKFSFDTIIGSVHAVRYDGYTQPYSTIDFSQMTEKQIDEYVEAYFDDLLEMVKSFDCDIVAHLSCPLRYINGKYGLNVELFKYRDKISKVLDCIVSRLLSLEVNTSGIGSTYNELMPPKWVLEEYKRKGGYLISFGSDAHVPEKVGNGFEYAIKALTECGFDACYFYKNRKPQRVDLLKKDC